MSATPRKNSVPSPHRPSVRWLGSSRARAELMPRWYCVITYPGAVPRREEFVLLTVRHSSDIKPRISSWPALLERWMTQAARGVARRSHSPLALLSCLIVLTAAVEFECAPSDILLPDATLAWNDDAVGDDPEVTDLPAASDTVVLNTRVSIVRLEDKSETHQSRAAGEKVHGATSVDSRGPPRSALRPSSALPHGCAALPSPPFVYRNDPSSRSLSAPA